MLKISPDALPINRRFFETLKSLKQRGELGGVFGFAKKYKISYANLYTIKTKEQGSVKVEFLMYLVRDYNVSAQWLLTGKGNMFIKEITAKKLKDSEFSQNPEAFLCPFLSRSDKGPPKPDDL